ncbi:MAG: hypothetical protein K1Y02_05255 [Candidatus Hydrogenedentes bacterium]|nr:hypothetical protein [Candidatus Hydrogenedentota bacterium]
MDIARKVGVGLEMSPDLLTDEDSVTAFAKRMASEKPHAILLHLQDIWAWSSAGIIADTGIPTIAFAPIGTAVTALMQGFSMRPGAHAISSSEAAPMEHAFRMVQSKRLYEESRFLLLEGKEEKEETVESLGAKVLHQPLTELSQSYLALSNSREAKDVAHSIWKNAAKVVEPSRKDVLDAARFFVACKKVMQKNSANAIAPYCLEMLNDWRQAMEALPCLASTIFLDNGISFACDKDLLSALSLMLGISLLERPGYICNTIPETYKNQLILAHCTCATRLNGFNSPPEPLIIRSHAETSSAVATQVIWRKGQPVTVAQFLSPTEMLIDSGTVVDNIDTTTDGGCRTSVALTMDRMQDVRTKLGTHQVMYYGDHRAILEAFCQLYRIKVIHSPERFEPSVEAT